MKKIKDFVDIPLAKEYFRLEDRRLIRISDEKRWNGTDCTNQRMVWIGSKRIKTTRVIFALTNGFNAVGYTVMNDSGHIIEITNERVFMIHSYAKSIKVDFNGRWKKPYCVRYTPNTEPTDKDDRIMKCFETEDEAWSWFYDNMKREWHDTFSELDLLSAIRKV